MTSFGYTLMTEQTGPRELVDHAVARGGRRLRLRGDERPLLPVALGAGPRAVRLVGAGCGRPRDRAGRADDLRDLPDDPLPPGGRRAEGRDRAAARRGTVHPRPRQRARTSTSTSSARAGRPSTTARRCCARRSTIIRELHTGELVDHRGEYFQVDSARIWDLPEQPVEIAVAVAGDRGDRASSRRSPTT